MTLSVEQQESAARAQAAVFAPRIAAWMDLIHLDTQTHHDEVAAAGVGLYALLAYSPSLAPLLRHAILDGKIDGGHYGGRDASSETACCLFGWSIRARARAEGQTTIVGGKRSYMPDITPHTQIMELLTIWVHKGDTPQNNPVAAYYLALVDAWIANAEPVTV